VYKCIVSRVPFSLVIVNDDDYDDDDTIFIIDLWTNLEKDFLNIIIRFYFGLW